MFANWVKSTARRQSAPRRRPARPQVLFRPELERLECRLAPATLTVINTNDAGAGSFRNALATANNGDTINFALASGSTIQLTSSALVVNKSLNITGPGSGALTVAGNGAFG